MRVLFISGSIGLGHAQRDLAIARELRDLDSRSEIEWLAGAPARQLIADAGETVLPQASELDETQCAEDASDAFTLNLVRYVTHARGAWTRSITAFAQATAGRPYDLIVGDEAYEIAGAIAKRPALKTAPFTMIYDFVGIDATSRNPLEHLLAYRWNRAWCATSPADLTVFVGEPEASRTAPSVPGCPTGATTRSTTTRSSATCSDSTPCSTAQGLRSAGRSATAIGR